MTESAYTRFAICTDNLNSIYYKKFDIVDFILIVMLILLVALCLASFLACLTTSIGLTSASGEYLVNITKGKIKCRMYDLLKGYDHLDTEILK